MEYNQMQLLKRKMFAMRNGIIADALRKAGSKFEIIFGVNLPQLAEIASQFPKSYDFAQEVWANSTTRESMLIAPMLMPHQQMSHDEAIKWIQDSREREVVDVLCLKLLRHLPFAHTLAQELISEDNPQKRYAGLRLWCNLAPQYPQEAAKIGIHELNRNDPTTISLAKILTSYGDEY